MSAGAILWAILTFALWEAALWVPAMRLAHLGGWRRDGRAVEYWLAVLAIQLTLESSCAALLSFAGLNSRAAYWIVGGAILLGAQAFLPACGAGAKTRAGRNACAAVAALTAPLLLLSFRPVQEIDSINYLHYLLDWMANRATPYTFASGYVAFWELSFLPAWTVTGVDFFFPLLALKAVALLAGAAWLAGRELGLDGPLLLWTVFGTVAMRHLWDQFSGVPTLKNDALHGAGFVLLALVVLRARRARLLRTDLALLAFGMAFVLVKYTGIFFVLLAVAAIVLLQRRAIRLRGGLLMALFVLVTSGHFYLRTLLLHGSPFYPFQINLGPIHLPGTADLSNTSILYSLGDPRLWRVFFLPAGGVSPIGLLFPVTLAAALVLGVYRLVRWRDWAAASILCGWLLYFRSVYSASASPGDLGFLLNDLNTIRYVDGVLALTELWLVALMARVPHLASALVAVNVASRLAILYFRIPVALFPLWLIGALAVLVFLGAMVLGRYRVPALAAGLVLACPFVVERNRARWTPFWDDLKPSLAAVRGPDLAELAIPESGYFAGHVVAAGNPVHPEVRSLSADEIAGMPAAARPRYLAVLPMPGAPPEAWRARWDYQPVVRGANGALWERALPPARTASAAVLDAWYVPAGIPALAGTSVPPGHTLRPGDLVVSADGALLRLAPEGRQPLEPSDGVRLRLRNCGPLDSAGKPLGAGYRREAGQWISDIAPVLSGAPVIGQGKFRAEARPGGSQRITAENDASFLAYVGRYPASLPDNTPVTLRALVRCPKGCVLAAIGRLHGAEQHVGAGEEWTTARLQFVFHRADDPQHYSIGINACRAGDWFEVRGFELSAGAFPF
jgi:hypothetical protein